MRLAVTVLVLTTFSLAACSGGSGNDDLYGVPKNSRVNPASRQGSILVPKSETIFDRWRAKEEVYQGTPVDQISAVVTEKTLGGTIVKVTGLPLRQGAFDVRLTNDTDYEPVNGVLTYTLKAVQPEDAPQGEVYLREVYAGVYISDADLAHIKSIQILGARNQRVIRR